jgi:UDP-2,3-diacylglucosamine pyrophosphatase LpxH
MELPLNMEYIVIGDVHGCIDELKSLLKKKNFPINNHNLIELNAQNQNKAIVLLGDFIDKGNEVKIEETIEFIYKNYQHLNQKQQQLYLILGNHEEMVYRYITKDSTLKITPKTIKDKKKYYNTVALLEKKPLLKRKFIELYQHSKAWYYYKYSETFSVTLTHAPCPEEYLRKDDEQSRRKMIKCVSRSKNPDMKLDELIPYAHREAKENQHYHIFGHLSQPNIRHYKNRICIDTSAIYGGTLSCAIIKENQLSFDSVPFKKQQESGTQYDSILFDF